MSIVRCRGWIEMKVWTVGVFDWMAGWFNGMLGIGVMWNICI